MSSDSQQISFFPQEPPTNEEIKAYSVETLLESHTDADAGNGTVNRASTAKIKKDEKLSPLMRQYNNIKARYPNTVLLYRMGDFYELFGEDAKIGARVLGITLTSRNHGGCDDTPLAGFPYHALDRYANRLVKAGYKIAICEQIEDPKLAKGIVKRDVVEEITIGTATEDNFIDERVNNFIAAVYSTSKSSVCGLAICDLSTGFFQVEELAKEALDHELVRIDPGEVLIPADPSAQTPSYVRTTHRQVYLSRFDGWKFEFESASDAITTHFAIASVQGLGLEGYTSGVCAAGALIRYLKEQKKNDLRHITSISARNARQFAELDPSTIRNLELFKPMQSDDTGGTLIEVLDRTSTSMGGRMLRRWLSHPLRCIKAIDERLDCVEWFKKDTFVRGETELFLKSVADLERLISRVTFERANGRDVNALKKSFETFPHLQKILEKCTVSLISSLRSDLNGFEGLVRAIGTTLVEDPPLSIKEGGMIRKGVDKQLDEIHDASINGKQWIARLQETERQRTGIGSLKVGYNKVFGYYIEVTSANAAAVPKDYIRKQTLTNGERFITPDLKAMEEKILGAQEKIAALEYEIFVELRKKIANHCERIQKAALAISALDIFVSLGRVAAENSYCRPQLDSGANMIIKEGRHPVVENINSREQFVPNDTEFISGESQIMLITGPNMAGKSTYLRQNALIAIMAQMGSFVPAASAQIGLVDKFFTRIGASDRLARGQSTFLVEMIEVANILNNSTDKSFVLLDEVGRGTSTFDGISIAWAVAEHLHESSERTARTLFATHYHELTEMSLLFPRIKNLHVKVKEWNDQIIFLRKIDTGSCDHSYGIQVARLAGVPTSVILRAKEILSNLENMELTPDHKPVLARKAAETDKPEESVQLSIINAHALDITARLKTLDINSLTPLDALNMLSELRRKAVEE
ncbi:MAG: DNA mismatch repair protein MutS [Chitinispirillales bacterium]|jgi:DNA mismatch repair protein MutS|nr:DNA mismatch repair protein MutS [Chitinispirillales bacterium]